MKIFKTMEKRDMIFLKRNGNILYYEDTGKYGVEHLVRSCTILDSVKTNEFKEGDIVNITCTLYETGNMYVTKIVDY